MIGLKSKRWPWAKFSLLALFLVLIAGFAVISARPSEVDWPVVEARNAPSATGLDLRFIGVAGFVLSDGQDTLVLDGFVSRPSLYQIVSGPIRSDVQRIANVRERTGVRQLGAVMTSHSHYDHALDAPEWVRQAGGEIWGTRSTGHIARAEGIDAIRIIAPKDTLELGAFEVTVFGLDHAPGEMMRGNIGEDFVVPAKANAYLTGGGLGFYYVHGQCRILAVPSAGLPNEDLSRFPADVVLLSIGQLGLQDSDYIRRYWRETVLASQAKQVILIHWDDFTRPLDTPLKPMPYVVERVDLAFRELTKLAGDEIHIGRPVLYEPLDLTPSGRC